MHLSRGCNPPTGLSVGEGNLQVLSPIFSPPSPCSHPAPSLRNICPPRQLAGKGLSPACPPTQGLYSTVGIQELCPTMLGQGTHRTPLLTPQQIPCWKQPLFERQKKGDLKIGVFFKFYFIFWNGCSFKAGVEKGFDFPVT